MKKHPCHKVHLPKLNRIEGQVKAIKKMIEEERYCIDILSQLKAVRGAVLRVQKEVLNTHVKNCVRGALQAKDEKEMEIGKLKDELNAFKSLAEKSKNSYEEILDKTTKSIEEFIENVEINQEKNIQ